MSLLPRFARAWPLLGLSAIVLASAVQAVWWVFLVPIYQSPDEWEHLDYALAINARRGLLFAQRTAYADLPAYAHTYTPYLRERAFMDQVRFNPSVKMPQGYGTPEFFAALDRDAPPAATINADGSCQLAALYPFGYYALLAVWIQLVRYGNDGIVAVFFGARLFSVVLLAISLTLTYATTRLLRFRPGFALLVTACIGTFPLTSFIASYVQPDNLSFTLVSLCFYSSLRAKVRGLTTGSLLLLGATLGALLVTKTHYWLCVTPAAAAMIVAEMAALPAARRNWFRAAAALALPSIVLGGVRAWTVWGTENHFTARDPSVTGLAQAVQLMRAALDDFFEGTTHLSFWGRFGWVDTPLIFGDMPTTWTIDFLLQAVTYAALVLTLWRLEQTGSRLFLLARAGRARTALRIALSNPAFNSFLLFSIFMPFLHVWTWNRFGSQGRNWFPFMLPIALLGLWYAPRALTLPGMRRTVVALAAAGFLLYGVVGNYYARVSIRERFYEPTLGRPLSRAEGTVDPAASTR